MVSQPFTRKWVLLSYRMPREPSTPRIAVWRRLREIGAVQVGDGLVALPSEARTREHFDWVATRVIDADGSAIVWNAEPTTKRDAEVLAKRLNDEREAEYVDLLAEIRSRAEPSDSRTIARWRRQWRRIDRRDYLGAPRRDDVRLAIGEAAENLAETKVES